MHPVGAGVKEIALLRANVPEHRYSCLCAERSRKSSVSGKMRQCV